MIPQFICNGNVELVAIDENSHSISFIIYVDLNRFKENPNKKLFISTQMNNAVRYLIEEGFIPDDEIQWKVTGGVCSNIANSKQ